MPLVAVVTDLSNFPPPIPLPTFPTFPCDPSSDQCETPRSGGQKHPERLGGWVRRITRGGVQGKTGGGEGDGARGGGVLKMIVGLFAKGSPI